MLLKGIFLSIIATSIALAVYFGFKQEPTAPIVISPEIEQPRQVYVGAWVTNFWDNSTRTLNTSQLTEFEQQLDKKMAFANIYSDWRYLPNEKLISQLNEISSHGWTPIISSNPHFFEGCPEIQASLYAVIASGACDEFLRSVAQNLKSYPNTVLLRFAWEMNLPDMHWSVENVNSTPDEFIAAWRHFHTILVEEEVTNVEWVLSFNTSHPKTIPYAQLYPGDEYVDWVAIDGYNWGNSHPWSGWASFAGVFKNSYEELIAVSDKPLMISEVNSAPTGGDKAEWLTDMLEVAVPYQFPRIQAIIFFNENKTTGESVDWRLERSTKYLEAVTKALNQDLYRSEYP